MKKTGEDWGNIIWFAHLPLPVMLKSTSLGAEAVKVEEPEEEEEEVEKVELTEKSSDVIYFRKSKQK